MAGQLIPGPAEPAVLPVTSVRERPARSAVARIAARVGLVVLKRAVLLATLLAVVFVGVELLPGDAAGATSERGESAADLARRRETLGLDRPVLVRFWDWMSGLPTGDLGTSAHGGRVTDLLTTAFPNTLVLSGTALVLTALLSLTFASCAALRPEGRLDRIVTGASTAVFAVPEFVVAVALVLVLSLWTGWLPAVTLTDGDGDPASWTMLVLPVLALTIPQTGWNTRIARAALADEARAPYVEAAVFDGLSPRRVLLLHVLPGALPTIATGLATSSGVLLGGAVAVETIFNYPGIGSVSASAVADRDTPVIAGVTVLAGAAITVVLLVADLLRPAGSGPQMTVRSPADFLSPPRRTDGGRS
ncbi:ABC transporter permease [Streptomyces sp. NPDC059582]|uniref:ABC transporter permease n=1 Tax=Streptomyces sp. NPDC059582 TaxID=3346875 RepID=UPI0036B1B015